MKISGLQGMDTIRAFQVHQALRLMSAILIGVILVKSGFSLSEVGQFEFFMLSVNFATFFWITALKNATLSYIPSIGHDEEKIRSDASILVMGISFVVGVIYVGYHYMFDIKNTMLTASAVYLVANSTAQLIENDLLIQDRGKLIFSESLFFYSLQLGVVLFTALYFKDITKVVWAMAIWAMLRFLYFKLCINTKWIFSFSRIRPVIILALPLVIHVLLGSGVEYIDGFIVDYYLGKEMFALFRYGARELPLNTIFVTAMVTAMIPVVSKDGLSVVSILKQRLSKQMDVLFPIAGLLLVVSPYAFPLVFNRSFDVSAQVFNVYLMLIISRVVIAQVFLYAFRENMILLYLAIVETIINVVLSLIFVHYWGILGVAYATLIAYIIEKIMLVFVVQWRWKISLESYMPIKKYVLYSLALVIVFIFVSWNYG